MLKANVLAEVPRLDVGRVGEMGLALVEVNLNLPIAT
jgi:hypothetical protein